MSEGCTNMALRPDAQYDSLTGVQDVSCIGWKELVRLRNKFNTLWDKLDACSRSPGLTKYGLPPNLEEIDEDSVGLSTGFTGFFRILVGGDGDACTIEGVSFVFDNGALLDKIADPDNYSHLCSLAKKPWVAMMTDPCNGCSKFLPDASSAAVDSNVTDAEMTLTCNGDPVTLYTGMKKVSFSEAPAGCGSILDWGTVDGMNKIKKWMDAFDCIKGPGLECSSITEICCPDAESTHGYAIAHYEDKTIGGLPYMKLRTIDVYVYPDGTGLFYGHLSRLIYADELQEIMTWLGSWAPEFTYGIDPSFSGLCDSCGPSVDADTCTGFSTGAAAFLRCGSLTYTNIAESTKVQGNDAGSCDKCDETAIAMGDFICLCPWQEMIAIMRFLDSYMCVKGCDWSLGGNQCGRNPWFYRLTTHYEETTGTTFDTDSDWIPFFSWDIGTGVSFGDIAFKVDLGGGNFAMQNAVLKIKLNVCESSVIAHPATLNYDTTDTDLSGPTDTVTSASHSFSGAGGDEILTLTLPVPATNHQTAVTLQGSVWT